MKEIIIVAGKCSFDIVWLRGCLDDRGYSSIQCETAEEVIEELQTLPASGVNVQLVIIKPTMLENIDDDIVNRLSACAPEVPFVLLDETDSPEIFERICAHRTKYELETSPLAKTLEGAGIYIFSLFLLFYLLLLIGH